MKRILSIICCISLLFSLCANVYAAEGGAPETDYSSCDIDWEFSSKLNKPIEFLKPFKGLFIGNYDVTYLIENLLSSKLDVNMQFEAAEDLSGAKIHLSINPKVPVFISEDVKLDADVAGHMWIEFDLSSVENAKYIIIVKNPVTGEYIYLNFFDEEHLGAEAEEFKKMMVETFLASKTEKKEVVDISDELQAVFDNTAVVKKDGDYTSITFTNDGFIDFVFGITKVVLETEPMQKALNESSVSEYDFGDMNINTVQAFVKGLGIFSDKDAISIKYKTDENNNITEQEDNIHFEFNIRKLLSAMGVDEMILAPVNVENSDLDITFTTKTIYSKINEQNIVQIPVLTEENSVNAFELIYEYIEQNNNTYYDEDFFVETEGNDEIQPQTEKFWDAAKGKMDRGGMYVDFAEFLKSAENDGDNLTGSVGLGKNNEVWIWIRSSALGEIPLVGNISEDNFYLDGKYVTNVRKPFMLVEEYNWDTYSTDKKIYVNMEVLKSLLKWDVQSVTMYLMDENGIGLTEPEYYLDIVRENPLYIPWEEYAEALLTADNASIGIIGGADRPTKVFVVTE